MWGYCISCKVDASGSLIQRLRAIGSGEHQMESVLHGFRAEVKQKCGSVQASCIWGRECTSGQEAILRKSTRQIRDEREHQMSAESVVASCISVDGDIQALRK